MGVSKEDEEKYQKLLSENEDLQRLITQVKICNFFNEFIYEKLGLFGFCQSSRYKWCLDLRLLFEVRIKRSNYLLITLILK